ncbi:surface layer protein SlpB [Lentilactobacillus parakefiri]|uniref:surface layer protein SlpB n=1 Tax=Lentilactobacillus parakefiri TaxID=152332 RepID=UPI0006F1389F|nr:surface layer protein SlpB [Lentilactobacillus parakefiri]KRL61116.1 hypothetical protein FD08_GL002949 [Lentilactobacillus parakefiri DSM 10551]
MVASKSTVSNLANANVSTANFRVYRVATTNRGSVYYKVVSFDQNFRGWIYGGKSTGSFAGGIAPYTTFTSTLLGVNPQVTTYKITTPGTGDDSVTWDSPQYTQYKVGKTITDSTPYANATFKVDQSGYRTREGSNDVWVHIVSNQPANTVANGWIKLSSLTPVQTQQADNAIWINLNDPSGKTVKTVDYPVQNATKGTKLGSYSQTSGLWTLSDQTATDIVNQINSNLTNSGYKLESTTLTTVERAALAAAQFGTGSVNIPVVSTTTNSAYSTITPYATNSNNNGAGAHALAAVNNGVVNAGSNFVDTNPNADGNQTGYLSASDFNNFSQAQQQTILTAMTKAYTGDPDHYGASYLNGLNAAFKTAAEGQYVAPSGLNFSNSGAANGSTFTSDQLMSYVRSNPSLLTLQSPKYPEFILPASSGTGVTVVWNTINYTASSGSNGTIGQPVNVFYNFYD